MKKNFDVIAFDLGNTLIRFDHAIAVKRLAGRFRIDSNKAYDLFFDSELTHEFEKGLISPAEFYVRAKAMLNIEIEYRDFLLIWNEIFWEDKDACSIVKKLKNRYRLFLLSNTNEMHFSYIEKRFDVIKVFDELILSYRVGSMKPDRKIYDHTIQKGGGDPARILYIDDREDLIGEAKKLGINTIRFEGAEKLRESLKHLNID